MIVFGARRYLLKGSYNDRVLDQADRRYGRECLLCSVGSSFILLLSFCTIEAHSAQRPPTRLTWSIQSPGKKPQVQVSEGVRTHTLRSLTLLDAARYPDDFNHFNYAEPSARKRGTLRTAEVGTFHNLAPFILQQSSVQVWLVYEQLFTSPRDDPLSSYPLIAESVEIAQDKSFVIFHLNPLARWQDGIARHVRRCGIHFQHLAEPRQSDSLLPLGLPGCEECRGHRSAPDKVSISHRRAPIICLS